MKRLGFWAAFLSTDKNAEARTKRPQTTEPQLFYIVCWRVVVLFSFLNVFEILVSVLNFNQFNIIN